MKKILSFLYRTKLLKINPSKVLFWTENNKPHKLILALEYGTYDVRKYAIEGLCRLKYENTINILLSLIDDPIQLVSEAAMQGLTSLTKGVDENINIKIDQKKQYWKNQNNKAKNRKLQYISNLSFNNNEKESSSQRLEKRYKQQRDSNHPPFGF